jgi:hypothetical protein
MNVHEVECDCFECADPHIKRLNRKYNKANEVDQAGRTIHNLAKYTDNLEGFDDERYQDGKVVGNTSIPLYKSPGGTLLKTFSKGSEVGYIYSATLKPDGVWLWIDSAKGVIKGWIKFEPWKFDLNILDKSVKENQRAKDALIEEKVTERQAANTSALYQTGKATVKTVSDVATGVKDTVSGAFSTVAFIGRNMKYIVILLIVVLVFYTLSQGKKFV